MIYFKRGVATKLAIRVITKIFTLTLLSSLYYTFFLPVGTMRSCCSPLESGAYALVR